ncbi:MAG: GldG family protein [Candidatus Tectimicrobiota bacterium]
MTEAPRRTETTPPEEARGPRRGALRGRSLLLGANTLVASLLALTLLGLLGALAARHSWRIDMTATGRYTLAPQSVKVVQAFTEPVKVTAFFGEAQPGRRRFKELMGQYAYHSPKLTSEVVDPDRQPAVAKRYKVKAYGTIVAERGEREERIFTVSEEAITNALVKVSRTEQKTVYFLTGHGEHGTDNQGKDGYSAVKEALEEENYEVKPLLLLRAEKVPADASVVVVAGPTTDLLEPEVEQFEAYLARGGKLLVLVDPGELPALVAFLKARGIELVADTLVDHLSRLFGAGALMPVVSQYTPHPITKEFTLASFFPVARSVRPLNTPPQGVTVQALASTGPGSWAETDIAALESGQTTFEDDQDVQGPVPVAAVATVETESEEKKQEASTPAAASTQGTSARLVVIGDSDFASNTHLHLSGNATLFLNTVSWLAEEEDLIAIRPSSETSKPLLLSPTQGRALFWLAIVAMPLAVAVVGGSVLWRRRAYR